MSDQNQGQLSRVISIKALRYTFQLALLSLTLGTAGASNAADSDRRTDSSEPKGEQMERESESRFEFYVAPRRCSDQRLIYRSMPIAQYWEPTPMESLVDRVVATGLSLAVEVSDFNRRLLMGWLS